MNLIFIYFSKRGGVGYWRGSLIRKNMVYNTHYILNTLNVLAIYVINH